MKITIWFHGLRTPSTYVMPQDARIIYTDDYMGFDSHVFFRREIKQFMAESLNV